MTNRYQVVLELSSFFNLTTPLEQDVRHLLLVRLNLSSRNIHRAL
jgi:hypothetical protein